MPPEYGEWVAVIVVRFDAGTDTVELLVSGDTLPFRAIGVDALTRAVDRCQCRCNPAEGGCRTTATLAVNPEPGRSESTC